jgi:hypothetical protein
MSTQPSIRTTTVHTSKSDEPLSPENIVLFGNTGDGVYWLNFEGTIVRKEFTQIKGIDSFTAKVVLLIGPPQSVASEKTLRTVVVADELTLNTVFMCCNVGDLVSFPTRVRILHKDWLPTTDGGFSAVIWHEDVDP